MEGPGVTNYAVDKPAFALSTATTEFDDALMQRGIVTQTQVMLAKGASPAEAQRLTDLLNNSKSQSNHCNNSPAHDDASSSSHDSSFEDDDEVLQRYRAQRTAQLQNREPIHIQRTEWKQFVNDESHQRWVVVCLTHHTERTRQIEHAVNELACQCPIQFVCIPCQLAIDEHFPLHNLPCLFLYRHGVLQKQLMALSQSHTAETLYELLLSHIE